MYDDAQRADDFMLKNTSALQIVEDCFQLIDGTKENVSQRLKFISIAADGLLENIFWYKG